MKNIDELGISPVPWYTGEENPYHERHVVFTKRNVGRTGGFDDKIVASCNQFFPESVADARLIKAAPKLYDALQRAVEWIESHDIGLFSDEWGSKTLRDMRVALAEASGESEEHA